MLRLLNSSLDYSALGVGGGGYSSEVRVQCYLGRRLKLSGRFRWQ